MPEILIGYAASNFISNNHEDAFTYLLQVTNHINYPDIKNSFINSVYNIAGERESKRAESFINSIKIKLTAVGRERRPISMPSFSFSTFQH